MNKMTAKEFIEVLNNIGLDFDIWGYEGILNEISTAQHYAAMKLEQDGCIGLSKYNRERSDMIYDILKERGYYEK